MVCLEIAMHNVAAMEKGHRSGNLPKYLLCILLTKRLFIFDEIKQLSYAREKETEEMRKDRNKWNPMQSTLISVAKKGSYHHSTIP